jgi:hypothetical protein
MLVKISCCGSPDSQLGENSKLKMMSANVGQATNFKQERLATRKTKSLSLPNANDPTMNTILWNEVLQHLGAD